MEGPRATSSFHGTYYRMFNKASKDPKLSGPYGRFHRLGDGDTTYAGATPETSEKEIKWPHLPVGVMTGTPDALSEQPNERADFVIFKPFTLDGLQEAIRRVRLPNRIGEKEPPGDR